MSGKNRHAINDKIIVCTICHCFIYIFFLERLPRFLGKQERAQNFLSLRCDFFFLRFLPILKTPLH